MNLGAKNFGAVEFLIIFKRAHSRAQKIIFLELGGNTMDEDRDSESVMEVHKIDEFMEDSMSGDGKDGNDGEVACFEQKKGEDDDDDDSDDGSDSDSDGSGEGVNAAVVGGKVLRRPSGEIGGELKESDESEKERNGVSEEERHDLTWSNPMAVGNVGLLSFSSDNDEFRRLARSEEMKIRPVPQFFWSSERRHGKLQKFHCQVIKKLMFKLHALCNASGVAATPQVSHINLKRTMSAFCNANSMSSGAPLRGQF